MVLSVVVYNVEHPVQPLTFNNILQTLFWGISTVTGTGFGILHPLAFIRQLIAGIMVLLGYTIFPVLTGVVTSGFVKENLKKQ